MNDVRDAGAKVDVSRDEASVKAIDLGALDRPAGRLDNDIETSESIRLIEETLTVSKQAAITGKVRVSTRTGIYEDVAEVTLDRTVVDVSRVPIGRIVDVAPSTRTEDGITIVPIIEERFVIVKQLYLTEELHIRHHIESELSRTPVQLRRQSAVVERVDADGQIVSGEPNLKS